MMRGVPVLRHGRHVRVLVPSTAAGVPCHIVLVMAALAICAITAAQLKDRTNIGPAA